MRNHTNVANNIIYPELSYLITGICFETQRELGRFCRQKQYCDFFETKLQDRNIRYEREKIINNEYIKGNRVDFIVDDKILLEMKSLPFITKNHYFQVQRYLTATNLKLAMLINFQSKYLKPKRIINNKI